MIDFREVSFTYPGRPKPALKHLNLSMGSGEVVLIAGPNGGGKSTLLKAILGIVPFATGGKVSGQVLIDGQPVLKHQTVELAGRIGLVLQDPETQVTSLTVQEEIQFGLANLKLPKPEIEARTSGFALNLGLGAVLDQSVWTLSGGQLQRLTLAALLAMKPKVLILDEPLANLDPAGVASVISALNSIKNLVPLMVVCTHWLDPFLDLATRVVIIDQGQVADDFQVSELVLHESAMLAHSVEVPHRIQLMKLAAKVPIGTWQLQPSSLNQLPIVAVDVGFKYPDELNWSLRDITLTLDQARVALVGHNGCGKSTLARLIAGLAKPTKGNLRGPSLVGLMLQKPTLSFLCGTVKEELQLGWKPTANRLNEMLDYFELSEYQQVSPFQLSGGEQRRLALALAMMSEPEVLILDEPTAGLDAIQTNHLLTKLEDFPGQVIFITHDTRVVAEQAHMVVALDAGHILFVGSPAHLTANQLHLLGYDQVNPTAKWAMQFLTSGIPLSPYHINWEVTS